MFTVSLLPPSITISLLTEVGIYKRKKVRTLFFVVDDAYDAVGGLFLTFFLKNFIVSLVVGVLSCVIFP